MLRVCHFQATRSHIFLALLGLSLMGCKEENKPTISQPMPSSHVQEATPYSAINHTDSMAHPAWTAGSNILSASFQSAQQLQQAITALLNAPSLALLEKAQQQWRSTAQHLEAFHVLTRLGTVDPQYFQTLLEQQHFLTAWPIQPGYIDTFGPHAYSGIVFDVDFPMTAATLRDQHGLTSSEDAILGLYPMEFLLFGENNSRGHLVFMPITELGPEYKEMGYNRVEELPRNRRRELLKIQATQLVEDIGRFQALWSNTQTGFPRHRFESLVGPHQTELLQKAVLALVTEQLVTLAQQAPNKSSTHTNDLWSHQQLADRLSAQLDGLKQLQAALGLADNVIQQLNIATATVRAIADATPLNENGTPNRVDWKESYAALRELIRLLNSPNALPQQAETTSEET